MDNNQDLEEFQYDLDKPRIAVHKITWRALKLAQRKGIAVLSNSITINSSFQHITCDTYRENGITLKTGEELYWKVYQSPRLPRVVLTPSSQHGHQGPPNPDARKSTNHQSEQRLYKETCRGNVDYRIPGFPHWTVQTENTNRKETVQKIGYPNRDWIIKIWAELKSSIRSVK